ncbi:MAG: PHP domain-containing protein [Bacillota bacterium]|nr:PHP domain-containing protein [Bacillota bacterium]
MDLRVDLHLHTSASDGKLPPEELVKLAKGENIDIIAVTDHDTTLGIDRALSASREYSLELIPGIELSTQHDEETVHVLGYFTNEAYKSQAFQKTLQDMKDHRSWRGKKIVENLKEYFGIEINYDSLMEEAKGVVARPHIARAIQKAGYSYDWQYIFDKIIGKDSPAYIPNKKLSTEDGIKLLRSVDAVTVLAHPILVRKTPVEELLCLDFDGLEAYYWQHSPEETQKFINLASSHNKLITTGSDFHGGDAGDTKHGYIGSVPFEFKHVEAFLSKFKK